jgi:hypothetical protein
MKRRNLLVGIAVMLMMLAISVAQAQDPWHVIVYEEETEVASFNVERLKNMGISTGDTKVFVELNDGQKFEYPIAGTFTFEPRPNGSGTGNEAIATPATNVWYDGANLHLENSRPDGVSIYSLAGSLIGKYVNRSIIPLTLPQGVYIARSGEYSGKFPATAAGGGTTLKVAAKSVVQAPPTIKSGTVPAYYFNVYSGDANHDLTSPVNISEVERWCFSLPDGTAFKMKNGNKLKVQSYKRLSPNPTPAPTLPKSWDMEKTVQLGGASYNGDKYSFSPDKARCSLIAVSEDIVYYRSYWRPESLGGFEWVSSGTSYKKYLSDKYDKYWDLGGKLSVFGYNEVETIDNIATYISYWYLTMSRKQYTATLGADAINFYISPNPYEGYDQDKNNQGYYTVRCTEYDFNGGTNVIPATMILTPDGLLTMEFTDYTGTTYSHTFSAQSAY